MKTKRLTQALERVEAWPADAQDALADIARDIDASLTRGEYVPTPEELAGIDRGLRDAEAGHFATEEQVDAALAKLRRA
jgi:predicted transcriptional regulator